MRTTIKLICSGIAGVLGIILLIVGGLTIAFYDESVDKVIFSHLVVEDGSEMYTNYKYPPVTPYMKVYFFNVTNPLEYLNGDKPVLKEVGPYVYKQHWVRENVSLHSNGTMSGALKKTYFFDREKSSGPESDMVTIIDMPTVTAVWQVRNTPRFIQLIFSSMLEVLEKGPFATRNVSDFLWGYEDELIKMARDIMPPENRLPTDYFGFFYGQNGTAAKPLTQNAGSVDDMSHWMDVQRVDGKSHLDYWASDKCNKVHGSDGGGFPPGINRRETLYLFNGGLCRALPLSYQKDVEAYGIKGYRFAPPSNVFDVPAKNPDNKCYCVGGPPCIGGGVFNVTACKFGSPTVLSWPHFYQADQKYLDAVIGLNPREEDHQFSLDVIPRTGLLLRASPRMQINVQLVDVPEIKPTQGVRSMVFPVLWFQDGVPEMPEKTVDALRLSANLPETIKITILSLSFVLGFALLVGALTIAITLLFCSSDEGKPKTGRSDIHGHVNPALDHPGEKD